MPTTHLYWGDMHQHSYYSADSTLFGNHRVGPDEAYRFAKGEAVQSSGGKFARLQVPLDFLVVSDHAEVLGMVWLLRHPTAEMQRAPLFQPLLAVVDKGWSALAAGGSAIASLRAAFADPEVAALAGNADAAWSAWRDILANAERHNQPGHFTALIGYEWSSTPKGSNLHRVVVYRDGADKAGHSLPVSSAPSARVPSAEHPEALWAGLRAWEKATGGQALAIPHNGNLSGGLMFRPEPSVGPMNREYARERARWEPVVEVTQIKGDGETHPLLSPTDEFADYETWDRANIMNTQKHSPDQLAGEYAREALKVGLSLRRRYGVNPFQFGMIGSSDSHTGLSTVAEGNFWGKSPRSAPRPGRMLAFWSRVGDGDSVVTIANSAFVASGYAAVWARENTRAGIFDALRRREVYATTGPRITLRFFGGWDFDADDVHRPDFAALGYRDGVPMGGTLPGTRRRGGPIFMVSALKDPRGAHLDRVQIVKGWLDSNGNRRERVYDVVVSGGRRISRSGRASAAVGDTVNPATASYRNTIGAASLSGHWRDPHFLSKYEAFYYLRALEIPTPRWTTYDAAHFGDAMPEGVPVTTQERAYSSPIWYQP